MRVTEDRRAERIRERILDHAYRVSVGSFFQSGPAAATLLARTVDSRLPDKADWLVDAYAGIGVLGITAARRRQAQLTLIEQDRASIADAKRNAKELETEVLLSAVADVAPFSSRRPDAVIADPARTGLGPSAVRAVAAFRSPILVLVSCDPASLARDTTLLEAKGLRLADVTVLDLFPQTAHVETVSVFRSED